MPIIVDAKPNASVATRIPPLATFERKPPSFPVEILPALADRDAFLAPPFDFV
jgi:hypothetical protein